MANNTTSAVHLKETKRHVFFFKKLSISAYKLKCLRIFWATNYYPLSHASLALNSSLTGIFVHFSNSAMG